MRHRLVRVAAVAVGATAVILSGAHTIDAQETASVDVQDNQFVEPDIVVTAGDTVQWTQSGSNPHSVTADDGSFDSHPDCFPVCMGPGDSFSHTFEEPGDHRYYCKVHGGPDGQGMSGIVRVRSAQQEPTSTTTTEPPVTSTTEGSSSTTTTSAPADEETAQAAPETAESSGTLPNTGVSAAVLLLLGVAVAAAGVVVARLGRSS